MKKVSKNDILTDLLVLLNYSGSLDLSNNGFFEGYILFNGFSEDNYTSSLKYLHNYFVEQDVKNCKKFGVINDENGIIQDNIETFYLSDSEINTLYNALREGDYRHWKSSDHLIEIHNHYSNLVEKNKSHIPIMHIYYYWFVIERLTRNNFEREIKLIKENFNTIEYQYLGFSTIYKEKKRIEIENLLYSAIENNVYSPIGFIDEKGLYIDYNKTILSLIERASKEEEFETLLLGLNKSILEEKFKHSHIYFLYNWYNEYFLGNEAITENLSSENIAQITEEKKQFDELYNYAKSTGFIDFLSKRFNEMYIRIILSIIAQKQFSLLNVRYSPFKAITELFAFCYYIGYFKFLEEDKKLNLESYSNFEILEKHINFFNSDKVTSKVLRDYYKQRENPNNTKRFPFAKKHFVLDTITNRLGFEIDKLVSIPTVNPTHLF